MSLKVAVLDRATLVPRAFEFDFDHELTEYDFTHPQDTLSRMQGQDIVIANKVDITAEVIRANPQLRLIAVAATGVNNVDVATAKTAGVTVCNVRHYGDHTVAEHAFCLMLSLMRQLPAYQRDVAAGLWQQSPVFYLEGAPIRDVYGKTLTIIGRGAIGQALAQRAQAFAMKIVWAEHKGAKTCREGYTPFEQAIQVADVLSLHCPYSEATHHLIGENELKMLKPGAVLLNVARGGLVDEEALVAALKYGQLGGAGVDVLSQEPPVRNPLLANLPHLILTPHVAWASQEAIHRLFDILVDNINAFAAGKPQSVYA